MGHKMKMWAAVHASGLPATLPMGLYNTYHAAQKAKTSSEVVIPVLVVLDYDGNEEQK